MTPADILARLRWSLVLAFEAIVKSFAPMLSFPPSRFVKLLSVMDCLIVLVHSPLVSPFTWSKVAEGLRQQKVDVLVPNLTTDDDKGVPYWKQCASEVKQALSQVSPERRVVLVAHSGAGPLLPSIRDTIAQPVAACLFVDASLPHPNQSTLDELAINAPELAKELYPHLLAGGSYPNWSAKDLSDTIPDPLVLKQLLAELRPQRFRFFEEKMPQTVITPDTPCGYILLSDAYQTQLEQAQKAGWPCRIFHDGHFHMLVDPPAMTSAIIDLLNEMGVK